MKYIELVDVLNKVGHSIHPMFEKIEIDSHHHHFELCEKTREIYWIAGSNGGACVRLSNNIENIKNIIDEQENFQKIVCFLKLMFSTFRIKEIAFFGCDTKNMLKIIWVSGYHIYLQNEEYPFDIEKHIKNAFFNVKAHDLFFTLRKEDLLKFVNENVKDDQSFFLFEIRVDNYSQIKIWCSDLNNRELDKIKFKCCAEMMVENLTINNLDFELYTDAETQKRKNEIKGYTFKVSGTYLLEYLMSSKNTNMLTFSISNSDDTVIPLCIIKDYDSYNVKPEYDIVMRLY